MERQLVENFARQDMTVGDSIEGIKRFIKELKKSDVKHFTSEGHGNKLIEETARKLGISREWLGKNLKFEREAPKELKQAVKEKKISSADAIEVLRVPKEEREEFVKEILSDIDSSDKRRKILSEMKRDAGDLTPTESYQKHKTIERIRYYNWKPRYLWVNSAMDKASKKWNLDYNGIYEKNYLLYEIFPYTFQFLLYVCVLLFSFFPLGCLLII